MAEYSLPCSTVTSMATANGGMGRGQALEAFWQRRPSLMRRSPPGPHHPEAIDVDGDSASSASDEAEEDEGAAILAATASKSPSPSPPPREAPSNGSVKRALGRSSTESSRLKRRRQQRLDFTFSQPKAREVDGEGEGDEEVTSWTELTSHGHDDRERERKSGRGRERERERDSGSGSGSDVEIEIDIESERRERDGERARQREKEERDRAIYRFTADKTWIGGQTRGQSTLVLEGQGVEVYVYNKNNAGVVWHDTVRYEDIRQFGCPRKGQPYFVAMDVQRGRSEFATFYDVMYAETTSQSENERPRQYFYGALFFFNAESELRRFQAMAGVIEALDNLLHVLPQDDTDQYLRQSGVLKETTTQRPTKHKMKAPSDEETETSDETSKGINILSLQSPSGRSLRHRRSEDVEVVVQLTDDNARAESSSNSDSQQSQRRSRRRRNQQKPQSEEAKKAEAERKEKLLLSYPFEDAEASGGRITITHGDIDRLAPGEFLNDTIIDFFFRYVSRHIEPWQQAQTYFLSPHFFTQLCGGNISKTTQFHQDRFERVSRWTAKERLFDKKFLFVPINDSCHWSVAVICNPGSAIVKKKLAHHERKTAHTPPTVPKREVVQVDDDFFSDTVIIDQTDGAVSSTENNVEDELEETYESRQQRHERPPCLLFLDSLRCHRKKKIYSLLRSYLEAEFASRRDHPPAPSSTRMEEIKDESSTTDSFDSSSIRFVEPDIPLQTNSSDCGVFLLMYAMEILRRFPTGISKEDIETNLSSSVSTKMFDEQNVREFRDYLSQLLYTLQALARRGGSEMQVREECVEFFSVDG